MFPIPAGYFQVLNHRIRQAALRRILDDVSDLIEVWTAASARRPKDAFQPAETFVEFHPPPKQEVLSCIVGFKPSSLPVPLTSSHSWSATVTDRRRHSLLGRGAESRTLTGIWLRAHLLVGHAAGKLRECHPVLADAAEAAANEEAAPANEDNQALLSTTKSWNGWRVSYRMEEPEKHQLEKYLPRLQRKMGAMAPVRAGLPEASLHRSELQMREAAEKSAKRRNVRAKRLQALETRARLS